MCTLRDEVTILELKTLRELRETFFRRNRHELGLIPPLIPSFTLVEPGIGELDLQVGLQVQETAGLDQAGSGCRVFSFPASQCLSACLSSLKHL